MQTAPSARWPRRAALAWGLLAVALTAGGSLAADPAGASRVRRVAARAPEPSPDAALYGKAKAALAALRASSRRSARREEWEKAALNYRRVVARYPRSGYADDSLFAIGEIYREMGRRFKDGRYHGDAVKAYRAVATEYPTSRHREPALFQCFALAQQAGDRERMAEAARAYFAALPSGPRAAEIRERLERPARVRKAALPRAEPADAVRVANVRTWSGETYTRVAIDLERRVKVTQDRIQDPDRIWIDLHGTRLDPALSGRTFAVGDGLLKQIRIAQNRDEVVRVVLDLGDVEDHNTFFLESPSRFIVDIRGTPAPRVASARPEDDEPPAWDGPGEPPDVSPPGAGASPMPGPPPTPLPASMVAKGWVQPSQPKASAPATSAASDPAAKAPAAAPTPPLANRAGSYSLARQLGLGARTIVVDAGHGGRDPGSIGPGGLREKELVLDVALRLEKLLRGRLGAEVVMTRSTDVFVPLEERTAIANSRGADLFLSIHANAARNPRSRGVETYFLNFAGNPHAEAVAARENAVSAATMKDLQDLVKAIALNSKIDESKDFAAAVQEEMVGGLRPHYPAVVDRGVHTAPFYVLIGANMPSVLAEISFVSNPAEERLLKKGQHRQRIAESLFAGVGKYLEALNRGRLRQLTEHRGASTVTSKERR